MAEGASPKITMDQLERMTPEQRAQLYENARRRRDRGGQQIMDLIDNSGLPLRAGGMTVDDPVYRKMEEIVWSQEGRAACLRAVAEGHPALAGVEPMICRELGTRYHPHDQGTVSAGSIVGELMRHLGYDVDGQAKMPEGSVAKTAMKWKRREK